MALPSPCVPTAAPVRCSPTFSCSARTGPDARAPTDRHPGPEPIARLEAVLGGLRSGRAALPAVRRLRHDRPPARHRLRPLLEPVALVDDERRPGDAVQLDGGMAAAAA